MKDKEISGQVPGADDSTRNAGAAPKAAPASAAHIGLIGAWALAFGCAIGWDAVVMPWTTFLPKAGPLGTCLGILIGGLVMAVIAWNYNFMIGRRPGPGGAYTYATAAFGADHGFLCAWFLCFTYIAITWMDAAVLSYYIQHAWGLEFKFSLRYDVAGYGVTTTNILLSILAIAYAAAICTRRRFAGQVQTVLATIFALGIVASFVMALVRHEGGFASMGPAFAQDGVSPIAQILGMVALAPWLFVGFESISHSSGEFNFPRRRTFGVMAFAIASVVISYVFLALIPALIPNYSPDGAFASWTEAVAHLSAANGTAYTTVGRSFPCGGIVIVSTIFFTAIFTNLVGNTIAASRLLAAMSEDGALPPWFGARNNDGAPRNSILAIATVSILVFALGQTVIGIVVDLALVGAAIAYAYTSAATFKTARLVGNRLATATGAAGFVLSVVIFALFVLPSFSGSAPTMATASYLVLVVWCLIGLLMFLSVFRRDQSNRFGRSPVVWLTLSAMIVFLSVLWIRQATVGTSEKTFGEVTAYHDDICPSHDLADKLRETIRVRQDAMMRAFLGYSFVQTGLTVMALVLMLYLFTVLRRREREREEEKAKAKSLFFSSVSHDIRTPLNAIVGFSEMLKEGFKTEAEREQAIDSILVSSKTLLALVNDVLDLSRLEVGKMEIAPEPTDCPCLMREVLDVLRIAKSKPGVELRLKADEMPLLMLDPQRLRQIVFNLVGNAVKFTERGYIELRASYDCEKGSKTGILRIEVEDTGCGISPEDLNKIASAYVQVGGRAARANGTGLGLAICKQLATAMGGEFKVASTLGQGSTFSVVLRGVAAASGPAPGAQSSPRPVGEVLQTSSKFAGLRRILLADDSRMNLTVLTALLKKTGDFEIATASDGNEALAALKASGGAPFDLVLTDLWMPNLDGAGLVKAIRADAALNNLKVVVVTADVELRGQYAAMGFDAILLKPITTATLQALLADMAKGTGK